MNIEQYRMRLRGIVKESGISHSKLAKRIGITYITYKLFLLGGNTGLKTFEKICRYLDDYEYDKLSK